ncbi:MAG: 6-hydroxymethylpterin diphosphokinase MptE-like protein [Leptonema sp. (in: bacteria)]
MLFPTFYLSKFKITKDRNFIIEDRKIHSKYQDKEYERLLKTVPRTIKTILLIGAGNGNILNYILNHFHLLEKIFVIEPIVNFIPYQKKNCFNNDFFLKVHYVYDSSELAFLLKKYKKSEYIFLVYPVYQRIFCELVDSILSLLNPQLDNITFTKWIHLWQRNYFRNLNNKKYLDFLRGSQFSQTKILFCGGGPTLIQDLKKYKNLKEFFIISSDTAVVPLLDNGISIDWVISIDPGIGTLYHFYKFKEILKKIPLITWLGSRWELSKIFSKIDYFTTSFPLDQILKEEFHEVWNLSTQTRDVKGYIISIAKLLNKKLFFAGCGIEKKISLYYVKNTGYDYYRMLKQDRIYTLEDYHYQLFLNQANKKRMSAAFSNESKNNQMENREVKKIATEDIIRLFFKKKDQILLHYKELKLFFDLF